jgi:hypothetical protein
MQWYISLFINILFWTVNELGNAAPQRPDIYRLVVLFLHQDYFWSPVPSCLHFGGKTSLLFLFLLLFYFFRYFFWNKLSYKRFIFNFEIIWDALIKLWMVHFEKLIFNISKNRLRLRETKHGSWHSEITDFYLA